MWNRIWYFKPHCRSQILSNVPNVKIDARHKKFKSFLSVHQGVGQCKTGQVRVGSAYIALRTTFRNQIDLV